jgi:hypothetical protein
MLLRRNWPKRSGVESSWVKKWRKRLTEGDPHDPSVLCSCSRAHHTPYFLATQSCKPHKYLCPAPAQRNGAILHATGCLVPRSKEPPHPNELRKPLEEIQMDFKDVGSVSPEQSLQGPRLAQRDVYMRKSWVVLMDAVLGLGVVYCEHERKHTN